LKSRSLTTRPSAVRRIHEEPRVASRIESGPRPSGIGERRSVVGAVAALRETAALGDRLTVVADDVDSRETLAATGLAVAGSDDGPKSHQPVPIKARAPIVAAAARTVRAGGRRS
jgi:hypothetical protein